MSTGTGSGKTECFLYPIVSRCLNLRDDDAPSGISAVIVYPMNALAEDQLMRLRGLLAGTGTPFGMYVGKTPEHEADVAGVRLPARSSRADYESRLERARREGSGETVYPAEEVCSREVMRSPGRQPRILLTNVVMLFTPRGGAGADDPNPAAALGEADDQQPLAPRMSNDDLMRLVPRVSGRRPAAEDQIYRRPLTVRWTRSASYAHRHERSNHEGMGCRGVGRLRVGAAALQ